LDVLVRRGRPASCLKFLSHSSLSGGRSLAAAPVMFGQVTDGGHW